MINYTENYLENHYDDHVFFDPECHDRRVREVNMRIKRCLNCPGLKACRMYPEYWLQGQEARENANLVS